MPNQSFPTVRYSRNAPPRLCESQEDLDALGPDWADSPAAFDGPAPEPAPAAEAPKPQPPRKVNRK